MDTSVPVLVVDDSQTIRLVISKHLHELGFTDIDSARGLQVAVARGLPAQTPTSLSPSAKAILKPQYEKPSEAR